MELNLSNGRRCQASLQEYKNTQAIQKHLKFLIFMENSSLEAPNNLLIFCTCFRAADANYNRLQGG